MGLLEGDLDKVTQVQELPQVQQPVQTTVQPVPGVKMFDSSLSQQQDYYETSHLRAQLDAKYPGQVDQKVAVLAQLVGSQNLPRDVINLAARREDGADILNKIVTDQDFTNKLILAGYDSHSIGEYSLKFNEIVDTIKPVNGTPKKMKPKPNEPLEPRPNSQGKDDGDTIWV